MHATHYIADVLVLLAAAIVAVPLFHRLGLGSVLGFLAAGALVGPWGLGFVGAVEEIRNLAEFGVVFLLFIIGIELKPSRLWVMRRAVFGLGSAQVLATGAVLTLAALTLGMSTPVAVIAGFGLALSSTAFGLQILHDKGELGTAHGRSAFAILLMQDLCIVPLIALLPLLARQDLTIAQDVELAALESVLLIVGVFVLGRTLLRPMLQRVAESRRNPEIFTATAILLVLGAAWLTAQAGLSMALGAFLGGLLLADSRYRHQIMADIQPFRGLLLGLFFMSVGMSIDFGLLARQGGQVTGLVGGLLVLKATLLWMLCRITGRSHFESTSVALLLAQAGEFGFVLFGLANVLGVMDDELHQLLALVVALSMGATPLLVRLTRLLGGAPAGITPAAVPDPPRETIPASRNHVIVAGFGRTGTYLVRMLDKTGVPHLALEVDPDRVARARAQGHPTYYGDARRIEVLRSAGAADASMVVFTMEQTQTIGRAVMALRGAFPGLPVYARAGDTAAAQRLHAMGVNYAPPETMAAGLQLAHDVLHASGVYPETVARLVDETRVGERRKIEKPPRTASDAGFEDMLLALTPGSDATLALARAAALAKDARAALTVVEVLTEFQDGAERGRQEAPSPEELDDEMAESRLGRLEALIAPLRDGLDVRAKVLVGSHHEAIAREVVLNGRDLVVTAAERRRGLRARVFGDDETRLLKSCPCPVLLLRSIRPGGRRHRRILACLYAAEFPTGHPHERDGVNRRILEHAAWLAAAEFAELHVVHAWEVYGEKDLRSGRAPFRLDADAYVERERKRNEEALSAYVSELRESMEGERLAAVSPVTHLVKGSRSNEIIRIARSLEADLVVIGTSARSGISAFMIESVADAVTKSVGCSVLFVKPPGFVTPVAAEEP